MTNPKPLPAPIASLVGEIQRLPQLHRDRLQPFVNVVVEHSHRRSNVLDLIQEALTQLRMDMKYLLFDLEATRRERDKLKGGA
jgi:hypothetical protein